MTDLETLDTLPLIAILRGLTPEAARQVAEAKGRLIISPNMDPAVIAEARRLDLLSLPGIFTPTEAFAALSAGAHALKLFPAEIAGPAGLKALRAVLPSDARLYAVGGVAPDTLADWRRAGASGFGIGSALYKPGMGASEVGERALAFVEAWNAGY